MTVQFPSIDIHNGEEMENFGAKLAANCLPGMHIHLQGDLGAGKTTLVRGFLHGLDYKGKVKSPTYTLVEPYQIVDQTIYHFDLYRVNEPLELEALGVRDYFNSEAICLIEWPEQAGTLLPTPDILIRFNIDGLRRQLLLNTENPTAAGLVQKLI